MLLKHVHGIIPTIVKCLIDCVIRIKMYYIVNKVMLPIKVSLHLLIEYNKTSEYP